MNKRLTIVYLLLTSLSLHPYSSYSHFNKTLQVYLHLGNNQRFSNKSSAENILETFIAQTTPIAVPFIMLGKLIVSKIKNNEANKFAKKAIGNIKVIYDEDYFSTDIIDKDITDVEDFINEYIKGTHITDTNLENIYELLK